LIANSSTQGTGDTKARISWWDSLSNHTDTPNDNYPRHTDHNEGFPFPRPKPKDEKKDVFACVLERALKNREALFQLFLTSKKTSFCPLVKQDQDPIDLIYRRRKAHSYRCTSRGS
jgi:hypothetical protein